MIIITLLYCILLHKRTVKRCMTWYCSKAFNSSDTFRRSWADGESFAVRPCVIRSQILHQAAARANFSVIRGCENIYAKAIGTPWQYVVSWTSISERIGNWLHKGDVLNGSRWLIHCWPNLRIAGYYYMQVELLASYFCLKALLVVITVSL